MKILFLGLFVASFFTTDAQSKKLLIIGIDGCRGDAIKVAQTPTLDSLMETGVHTLNSRTIYPTMSGPGWSSMLTGVWFAKHGVRGNAFLGRNFDEYPHFYNYVEAANPNLQTVSIGHWAPINDKIIDQVDYKTSPSTDKGVETEAVRLLSEENPDVIFLHFDDVDHAGHFTGFGPKKPNYISKIEKVDGHIRKILDALQARPEIEQEDWLIVVSTDHGGKGNSHGGATIIERTTFQIYNSKDLKMQDFERVVEVEEQSSPKFDGETAYLRFPESEDFKFGADMDFTIECWVYSEGWEGDPAIISDKNWKNGSNAGFSIAAHSDGERWKVNLGDGKSRIDIDGDIINDGRWHHLALSVDRDALVKSYQDGRLMGLESMDLGDLSSEYGLALGQDGTKKYGKFFKGSVKELRIWSSALSQKVLAEWNCKKIDKGHPEYGNLLGYWPMNETQGTIIHDHLGKANAERIGGEERMLPTGFKFSPQEQMPMMVDIVPTVLEHLGIPIKKEWGLDGRSLWRN